MVGILLKEAVLTIILTISRWVYILVTRQWSADDGASTQTLCKSLYNVANHSPDVVVFLSMLVVHLIQHMYLAVSL